MEISTLLCWLVAFSWIGTFIHASYVESVDWVLVKPTTKAATTTMSKRRFSEVIKKCVYCFCLSVYRTFQDSWHRFKWKLTRKLPMIMRMRTNVHMYVFLNVLTKTKLIFIKTDNAFCYGRWEQFARKSINNAKDCNDQQNWWKRPLSPFKMQQMSEPICNHHLIFCRAIWISIVSRFSFVFFFRRRFIACWKMHQINCVELLDFCLGDLLPNDTEFFDNALCEREQAVEPSRFTSMQKCSSATMQLKMRVENCVGINNML